MLDTVTNHPVVRLLSIAKQIAAQHQINTEIAPTDHLVDTGMTSIAMVDLMLAVEAEFDVMIPQGEMTSCNFTSIESIVRMLHRLKGNI